MVALRQWLCGCVVVVIISHRCTSRCALLFYCRWLIWSLVDVWCGLWSFVRLKSEAFLCLKRGSSSAHFCRLKAIFTLAIKTASPITNHLPGSGV
uniref:Putative secreted protein n=1 Tax=Anopheles marajoara TaxID=58244 RepID=A0A2M4C9L6_9DIPT